MEIVYTTFPSLLTGVFVGATLWMSTRSDPIQNLDFKFWPDYRVLTRSPDRSGELFKKKSKRRRFSKKNQKINELQPGLAGSSGQPTGLHRVFPSFIFSSTRPDSSSGSQVNPPSRAGFQNYDVYYWFGAKIASSFFPIDFIVLLLICSWCPFMPIAIKFLDQD